MSRLQSLKLFVNQRLNAAVEEIFGHFERTITEYEEELERRHRKLLDVVLTPEIKLRHAVNPADVQQLLGSQEEVPPEQQEWSSRVEQEQPEPPHIKEEQEELWTSQEGEEPLSSSSTHHLKTEADGDHCGGPEPASNLDPDRHLHPDTEGETSDSPEPETDDW
ncbi:uncharacterized protein ACBR49_017726, partial [Aulostomus maculatus]